MIKFGANQLKMCRSSCDQGIMKLKKMFWFDLIDKGMEIMRRVRFSKKKNDIKL